MSNQRLGKFWDKKQLAAHLGVPVSWIDKRTRKEAADPIPHHKLGKYVRFDPESPAFKAWLGRHETKPQTEAADNDQPEVGKSLTIAFPVSRVRATGKTGQIN